MYPRGSLQIQRVNRNTTDALCVYARIVTVLEAAKTQEIELQKIFELKYTNSCAFCVIGPY